ncbi:MAG: efflux RND transporter periplasmic adaptor subunit [Magnetococcales bacterium]|nr:efflux RND transporter periplasmic adaptor subunit [Magnetococcales bacterium]
MLGQAQTPGAVVTVESGAIGATTTLGGTVVPFKEVSLATQMPGRIEMIAGVEGDWFEGGALLVALNNDDLVAKRRSAAAGLAKAQAGWRNARVQYTRQVYSGSQFSETMGMGVPKMLDEVFTKPMSGMMGTTNPELTRRAQIFAHGIGIDQARFGLLQAQAGLDELDAKLRDTQTIAPFDGVIIRKHAEVGDTMMPGMPLLQFADTRHLQIKVDVPARLMPGIKKGMVIPARLDVGDARVDTRVAQVYPMADPQRHTVTVKLDLPTDAPGGPGMYAEVMVPDITSPVKNLPIIPKSAVLWRGSLPAVYVLGAQAEPVLRMVRLGGLVDNQTISVLSGIKSGERIVAQPPQGGPSGWNAPQYGGSVR